MGFVFVDRINAIDSDRARGELRRAAGAPPIPPWLVIEAVGQLAAWITMVRTDFVSRPVAALVGEIRIGVADVCGAVDLEARIDRLDGRAMLYSGAARVGDTEVAVLARCVGPLLPMELFDDPAAVRERADLLRGGRLPERASGDDELPRAQLAAVELQAESARARLHVPESAPFFADHFPRRPVYPATLLADAQNQLALPLAARALGVAEDRLRPARVSDFKVRSFSPPGQVLELAAESRPMQNGCAVVAVTASAEGKRVASGTFDYRIGAARST
jgi:3-hydroxymyristoyl/3-hydroxydecanoyl-(acyl carrier protein) dehydratase